jgi:hypothetical protein
MEWLVSTMTYHEHRNGDGKLGDAQSRTGHTRSRGAAMLWIGTTTSSARRGTTTPNQEAHGQKELKADPRAPTIGSEIHRDNRPLKRVQNTL